MKKIAVLFSLLVIIALTAVPVFAADRTDYASSPQTAPGDVLVTLRNPSKAKITSETFSVNSEMSTINSFASSVGANVKMAYPALSEAANEYFLLIHSDTLSETELLEEVRKMPDVTGASLNYVVHVFDDIQDTTPNDPSFSSLWGLKAINAQPAWDISIGANDIYSVVIDTGVHYTHDDLSGNFETDGYSRNFVSSISDPEAYDDEHSHGTHVAGTIGAVGDNNIGVVGVNWNVKIISLRVFDSSGSGYTSDICNAINYVTGLLNDNPNLKIASVNLSLGGYRSTTPQGMIDTNNIEWRAYSLLSQTNRTVICVAAGNEGLEVGKPVPYTGYFQGRLLYKDTYCYPASLLGIDNMIVVASGTSSKEKSSFSNYSSEYVDITAPGSSILSTVLNNSYGYKSGTSMATPHVAGAAALLMSINPDATPQMIKQALLDGANKSYCVDDGTSVNGFLDLEKAIECLEEGSEPTAPEITTTELPDAIDTQEYSAVLKASGTRPITWEISNGALPEGLTLNAAGSISGTPSYTGSTATFTVKATNEYGSDTKNLSLEVNALSPDIIAEDSLYAPVNSLYSHDFAATGTKPITWSLASGSSLPEGLTLSSTGTLSGTPTQGGKYNFSVTASNIAGSDTESFSLTVESDPTILTDKIPGASIGYYYFYFEGAGSGTLTWSLEDGELPGSLRLTSYGSIYGYVGPSDEGSHTFTVKLESSNGSMTKEFTLFVGNKPQIMEYILPGGIVDREYEYTLEAIGTEPLTWSLDDGSSLPDGLTLDSSGKISGTPTQSGSYYFYVKASNAIDYTTEYLYIYVSSKSDSDININTVKIPVAVYGENFSYQLQADGTKPITWEWGRSDFDGLTLSESGLISGTASNSGGYRGELIHARIKASNSTGSVTKEFPMIIIAKPVISTSSLSSGTTGSFYYENFYAYGDSSSSFSEDEDNVKPESWGWLNSVTWSIVDGELPAGLSLDVLGHLAGTPTSSGTYNFTVQASVSGAAATKDFTLNIDSGAPVITTESLDDAYRNNYYYAYIYADGNQPFTWEISEGSLPNGLTLYSYSGYARISGYPSANGDYTFTIKASNSAGYDTKQYTINVSERPIENLDFELNYNISSKILNGKTNYDKTKFNYIHFYLNKVYDYSQSLLERTAENFAREHEEFEHKLAEGTKIEEINGPKAIISDDDGTIRVEDAFTIEAGPIGYRQDYRYISPDHAMTYDLRDSTSYYYPMDPKYKDNIWLRDSADVAMKGREINWEFPDELAHLNGGITLDNLRSLQDNLETAPYFEFVDPNSEGKFTAVKYRLVNASDTSTAVSLGYDGVINFSAYGYVKSGDTTQYKSFFYDSETVSADDVVEGQRTLDTPIALEDLAYAYAYGIISDGTIRYNWNFTFELAPYIYTNTLPSASLGTYYGTYINAYNSVTSWDITSGELPDGLHFTNYGYLYGTPQESGTFTFTVRARNDTGSDTKEFTLNVSSGQLPSSITMYVDSFGDANLVNGKSSYEGAKESNVNLRLDSIFDDDISALYKQGKYEAATLEDGQKVMSFVRGNQNSVLDDEYKFIADAFTIEAGTGNYYASSIGLVDGSQPKTIGLRYMDYDDDNFYDITYYPAVSADNEVFFYNCNEAFKGRTFTWNFSDELSDLSDSVTLSDFLTVSEQLTTAIPYVELATQDADGKFTTVKWRLVKANNPSSAVALDYDTVFTVQVDVISDDGSIFHNLYHDGITADDPAEGEIDLSFSVALKNVKRIFASIHDDAINYTWCFAQTATPPEISTTELPNGSAGETYDFWFSADGSRPISWSITDGDLPEGLVLDTDGHLYGTPSETGTFVFTVEASNSYGEDEDEFELVVTGAAPVIVSDDLVDAIKGEEYSDSIDATGSTPMTWTITSGKLPTGIDIDSSTGELTGTPLEEGSFTFTVKVANDHGSDSKAFTLGVYVAPEITTNSTLASGTVGTAYSVTLMAEGTEPLTWSVDEDDLPPGLSLGEEDGKITGTPTEKGTYDFTVYVENDYGDDEKDFSIVINAPVQGVKPKIGTKTLFPAAVGSNYSATLSAAGTGPLTWTIKGGKLPTGLTLDEETGEISGTPTKDGKFKFKVQVENAYGKATQSLTIITGAAPTISSATFPGGLVGKSYKVSLKASGTKKLVWSIVDGSLPPGVSIGSSNGKISGKPKALGDYDFIIMVKNDYGEDYLEGSISVGMKPKITTGKTLASGQVGEDYSVTIVADGTTPLTWSKASGKLPDGLTFDTSTGEISGTPTKAGKFSFKIMAANLYGNHKQSFKITIAKASSTKAAEIEEVFDDGQTSTPEVENYTSEPEISYVVENGSNETQQDLSNVTQSGKSGANLYVIDNDGEPADNIVKIAGGQDLLFELGAWFDPEGHEIEVSSPKVYVNDEAVDAEISEDGTFVLDAHEAGDDFAVQVKAVSPSGDEMKSNKIYISIE